MTQFESDIKQVSANAETIYKTLSDLNNIEKIKDKVPQDKIKNLVYDTDSCEVSVDPVGTIGLRIIEKEPCKTIKFQGEKTPIAFFFWIQILPLDDNFSKMKLTVKADLNPFIKGMVSKHLQEGINKLAEALSMIKY